MMEELKLIHPNWGNLPYHGSPSRDDVVVEQLLVKGLTYLGGLMGYLIGKWILMSWSTDQQGIQIPPLSKG
jgi:hypothetical protein